MPVAQALVSDDQKAGFLENLKVEYERVRVQHAGKKGPELLSLLQARANKPKIDWLMPADDRPDHPGVHALAHYHPPKPKFIGRRIFKNYDLASSPRYIDWGPFFQTWDLHGAYPKILEDEVVGESARRVFADGQAMLQADHRRPLAHRQRRRRLPAGQLDQRRRHRDLYRRHAAAKSPSSGATCASRSPSATASTTSASPTTSRRAPSTAGPVGIADYIGLFAVTAGLGIEKKEKEFAAQMDDYSSIMLKGLADRFAEAFAECLHERVRKDLWGYAPDEHFSTAELVKEPTAASARRPGIRPARSTPSSARCSTSCNATRSA